MLTEVRLVVCLQFTILSKISTISKTFLTHSRPTPQTSKLIKLTSAIRTELCNLTITAFSLTKTPSTKFNPTPSDQDLHQKAEQSLKCSRGKDRSKTTVFTTLIHLWWQKPAPTTSASSHSLAQCSTTRPPSSTRTES